MKIFQNGLLKCKHVKYKWWARTGFLDRWATSVTLFGKHNFDKQILHAMFVVYAPYFYIDNFNTLKEEKQFNNCIPFVRIKRHIVPLNAHITFFRFRNVLPEKRTPLKQHLCIRYVTTLLCTSYYRVNYTYNVFCCFQSDSCVKPISFSKTCNEFSVFAFRRRTV